MGARYTDPDIQSMLDEPKPLPSGFWEKLKPKSKRHGHGHSQAELGVMGSTGRQYEIKVRQNDFDMLDFSVVLLHRPKTVTKALVLKRYNGPHEHTNKIENQRFDGWHIHTATERYQEQGFKDEDYAEPTDKYKDMWTALGCMIRDCGFVLPDDAQTEFPWGQLP